MARAGNHKQKLIDAEPTRPLGIVVVTYNSTGCLPALLDSLAAGLEGVDDYEIVIADNASNDNTLDIAAAHPARPTILETGRNGGYAWAINVGCEHFSDSADVLVLNPDLRMTSGAASALQKRLQETDIGIVVPKVLSDDGSVYPSLRREASISATWATAVLGGHRAAKLGMNDIVYDPAAYERAHDVDWATGAALLISAHARAAIGRWDESFFLYSEEVDYMRRARQSGFRVLYAPEATVIHTGGPREANPQLFSLMTINRLRDFARHNGRVKTLALRLGMILDAALRAPFSAGQRAAFSALLRSPDQHELLRTSQASHR